MMPNATTTSPCAEPGSGSMPAMQDGGGTRGSFITSRWAEFLAGDTDALPLRVFEVLFSTTFLLWMGRCFITWQEWLTAEGFHLNAQELTAMDYPSPFPLLPGAGVLLLAIVISVASVAHMLNRWRRPALLVLFASAVYVQGADAMAAFTLNKLYVAIYGILLVTPGYTRHAATGRLCVPAVAVRVLQATLIVIYFSSGLAKAFRGDWLKHGDVLYTQVQGLYRTDAAAWLLRALPAGAWTLLQWAALLFELEAPVLFCWRKSRPVALVFGLGYHLMIALLMKDLVFFSAQLWAFYALFLTADEWRALHAAFWQRLPWRGQVE